LFGLNLLLIYNNSAKIKTSVSYYLLAGMMGDGLNFLSDYSAAPDQTAVFTVFSASLPFMFCI
jgi:hypothetical protein